MKTQRGFTLIELLIVVAIIGILAAIAVPNFLNAQVRAKIAQVKANMKTIETALAQYRIDHNTFMRAQAANPPGQYTPLTSPVAYLASAPIDPFRPPRPVPREPYNDTLQFPTQEIDYGSFDSNGALLLNSYERPLVNWFLISLGPDIDEDIGVVQVGPTKQGLYRKDLYMSSNGLISDGDLVHSSWMSIQF